MQGGRIPIDWSKIAGARERPKRFHLRPSENSLYKCPVESCEHEGFGTKRGLRKHMHSIHPWFYYFDEKPSTAATSRHHHVQSKPTNLAQKPEKGKRSFDTSNIPSYPMSSPAGSEFASWLNSAAGGGKSMTQANQIAKRCLKFLKLSYEDEAHAVLTDDIIDFCLGSPTVLCKFITTMEENWKLSYPGQMAYLNAIADLIDYRKIKLPSRKVMENVSVTEIYLKRAKKCIGKMMKVQWTKDMDIDTLEAKGNWATMEEMLEVIPYHLPRYKGILERCKTNGDVASSVSPYDLSFANKFIANYLFINVKGSRPMTYQYLTLEMIETAKQNGGFIDQRQFKTAAKYGFDSLILDRTGLRIINDFVKYIRPRLKPKCDYLLVTRNGTQYDKLSDMMSKLVYDAIGKYIHPTRLRQIIETESDKSLSPEDRQAVSEDQKHSSSVAQIYYKKKRSREVATKARDSLQKLEKNKRSGVEKELRKTLELSQSESEAETSRKGRRDYTKLLFTSSESSQEEEKSTEIRQFPTIGRSPSRLFATASETCSSASTRNNESPKRLRFTADEDCALKQGIYKHGFGQWTTILRDSEISFPEGRTADSLQKRALSKSFSKATSGLNK